MTAIKVTLHPSAKKFHDGTICYQIRHLQKMRYIRTSYQILTSEWDDRTSRIIISPHSERKTMLTDILKQIRCDMSRISKIAQSLEASGLDYTTDDIIHEYHNYKQQYTLTRFMRHTISVLENQGRIRTSETYRSTLNSFMRFLNYAGYASDTFMLDNITSDILEAYETWMHSRGIVANTISFYNRILRAVYNRAVADGVIDDSRPFRHVYTSIGKTVKRALPLSAISKIKSLDLSSYPKLDYARDIFLMSFYMRGMSFIDMAMLRSSDLCNGYVTYRRRKTGQLLIVKWTKEMQELKSKYNNYTGYYLLPIITKQGGTPRTAYRNASYNINRHLKQVALMTGISIPLTLYVARHSWASAARYKGVPIHIISESLGHGSEATTQIYLASLDTSEIDRANAMIISSL